VYIIKIMGLIPSILHYMYLSPSVELLELTIPRFLTRTHNPHSCQTSLTPLRVKTRWRERTVHPDSCAEA